MQEEGIVVKNLDSAWMPNDRSNNNWVKLKPDYVHQSDIDAVVIGGRWGAGRNRAGGIAEYLLALAEPPPPEEEKPRIFVSFCRQTTPQTHVQHEAQMLKVSLSGVPRRNLVFLGAQSLHQSGF